MLAQERRDEIQNILDIEKNVTVKLLSKQLDVTMETIRSDLEYLEKLNIGIMKVHGGAYKIDSFDKAIPIQLRQQVMVKEKRLLGDLSTSLINDGDIIMLDSSSTCDSIAKQILAKQIKVTIISNSLSIINTVSTSPLVKIIALGGNLNYNDNAFRGTFTYEMLSKLHAEKCFLSPTALSMDFGISHDNELEAEINKKMIQNSNEVYLVMDNTKFGKSTLAKISDFSKVKGILTDKNLSKEWKSFLNQRNIKIKRP